MFVAELRELCTKAASKSMPMSVSEPSTLVIVFMAFVCALLPLDISQLSFAVLGAILYALLQKSDSHAPKKEPKLVVTPAMQSRQRPNFASTHPVRIPAAAAVSKCLPPQKKIEANGCTKSVNPVMAPTFHSQGWDGEVAELLLQITPTTEAEEIVSRLARMIRQTLQPMLPGIDVHGFANANFTSGKAFGVAVPEVDITVTMSHHDLLAHFHRQGNASAIDEKKLQKSAIRTCCDRLVYAGGFKFRRSAFQGREPKVTLLVPSSLGLFHDGIPIDFSVNVLTPLYNTALLTECAKMDSRARGLVLLVRRWAKDRGICHAAKGHLSPYTWGLLAIYFLQVRDADEGSLLPPLSQFESAFIQGRAIASDTMQQPQWRPLAPPTEEPTLKKSVGALFAEFVHFFETQFDWCNEAVSICAGRRAPPNVKIPIHRIVADSGSASQKGPSIEDPFQAGQNLGDVMTSTSLARLKEELSRADVLCLRTASLSELLEPWIPAEAAAEEGSIGKEVAPLSTACSKGVATVVSASAPANPSAPLPPPWRRSSRASASA